MVTLLAVSKKKGSAMLGLDDQDAWAIVTSSGGHPLWELRDFVALLPILERPYEEFAEALREALLEKRPAISPDTFPATLVVRHALEFSSAYWKMLAFEWVEKLPDAVSLIPALEVIGRGKGSQEICRRAREVLRALPSAS